ncbi:MAG TPA: histidine phosphatase family protein [Burkholderiales bacterium]|nr:histidine phosphatase family protein [Burkholderiales bacterium]
MAETRLLLIRHGETEWNREGRIQGYHADSRLTENGETQARLLAQRLAGEDLFAVHCSDSGRARQTAAPVAAALKLDIVYDVALRERSYGEFEGWTYGELEREHPEAYLKFRSRDPAYAPPGGESGAQFRDRIVAALERIAEKTQGGRAAVITHGGVLGVAYRHVTAASPDSKRDYSLHNASINRIVYSSGRWSLEHWGDVTHLAAGSGNGIQGA